MKLNNREREHNCSSTICRPSASSQYAEYFLLVYKFNQKKVREIEIYIKRTENTLKNKI